MRAVLHAGLGFRSPALQSFVLKFAHPKIFYSFHAYVRIVSTNHVLAQAVWYIVVHSFHVYVPFFHLCRKAGRMRVGRKGF
jgi:hypothetical protein